MARRVDYSLGRPVRCDGAATQGGGCGAIANPTRQATLPRGRAGTITRPKGNRSDTNHVGDTSASPRVGAVGGGDSASRVVWVAAIASATDSS